MKRGMEKERKGLFGRLLDFWKERLWTGEAEGIGFWNGAKDVENRFAETGEDVSVRQQKKNAFWKEKVGTVLEEKDQARSVFEREKQIFFADEEHGREKVSENGEEAEAAKNRRVPHIFTGSAFREERQEKAEKQKASQIFTAEVFRKVRPAEAEEHKLGQSFLWERPEEERAKRNIIPVEEEAKQKEAVVSEWEKGFPKAEAMKWEEPQKEAPFDIEKLMQEMTKKLWEERESCGRRLRG